MPYHELDDFMAKGQTRIKGTITQWNALGLILGALTGHLLARGLGVPSLGLVIVFTLIGVGLSIRYHGIAIPKRIALLCLWLVQSQAGYKLGNPHDVITRVSQRSPNSVTTGVRRASSGRSF